jgi:NADPH:quinone reductase-like Zn-dependent oxidoreductase
VFGIVAGAAHAEYVVAHERTVARVPDALDWWAAGAVPEAYMTAFDALRQATRVRDTVLVHAVGAAWGGRRAARTARAG